MAKEQFLGRHVGPRPEDVEEMLKVIGVKSVDELIEQTVPASIRLQELLDLPAPLTEDEFLARIRAVAAKNKLYRSFIGQGYYDTISPAVIIRNILENPAWYTSYTPYQAEVSQGRLEALLNYQTMIIELTAMEITNCSLLDEATAAAEARSYLKQLPDSTVFNHVIFVDRLDQNITTLEHVSEGEWKIRSMNPATTGMHAPPYAQETPLGMYLLQQKKTRMVFLKDGSAETGGYAPYASRFTNGAYIHGVPVNAPRTSMIEYSWSLGTTPRSHMCVRNATSHSKFVFDWAPTERSLVVVIE